MFIRVSLLQLCSKPGKQKPGGTKAATFTGVHKLKLLLLLLLTVITELVNSNAHHEIATSYALNDEGNSS